MVGFETELYTNNKHLIAKMYTLLLKFETERTDERMYDQMGKKKGHSIQMEQWENMQ